MEENDIFKTTALLYVKDALYKQEYESCAQLISLAKKFGAKQEEIKEVLASHIRGDKTGKPTEANRIKGSLLTKEKQ
jgi:hypothetical protein